MPSLAGDRSYQRRMLASDPGTGAKVLIREVY